MRNTDKTLRENGEFCLLCGIVSVWVSCYNKTVGIKAFTLLYRLLFTRFNARRIKMEDGICEKLKFSVFTDIHYNPGVSFSGDEKHLEFIQKRAERENCDFIIQGGDFTHGPAREVVQGYLKMYNEFHIPSYHCLGNHDTDLTCLEETLKRYNMPAGYYYFDCKGYRMIVCDPNYYCQDGEIYHYDLGNYYGVKGSLHGYMPAKQLAWLKKVIDEAPGSCILLSHESFEREADGVHNLMEVRKIINDANKKRKHSVLLCINGHHHRDSLRIIDGVLYLDLNSCSFDYVSKEHHFFPKEMCDQYSSLSHTVFFNDPLHAVITVEGSTITIDGMESSMFMGINREHTDNPIYDTMGRPVVPWVQSAKVTLW